MAHTIHLPLMLSLTLLGICLVRSLRKLLARPKTSDGIRRLGPYWLTAKIGQGGMGEVYRAWHTKRHQWCAVKVLPEGASVSDRARFEQEIRLTKKLHHPNTIAIHDHGLAADGTPYYAMELLEGATLERVVDAQGAQAPSKVIDILLQLCAALAAAHRAGLVHRDIKPDNVFLCAGRGARELVKLLDFGLVKQLDGSAPNQTSQCIVGTPLYLSPEAINAPDQVGPRSDLYALGAVGYFLLTGAPVFAGSNAIEVCHQHLHAVPERPSLVRGQRLDEELERIILACLAKDPLERPASATELATLLCRCADRTGQACPRPNTDAWPVCPLRPTELPGLAA